MDALAWCRERVLVPGQPLMASLPFVEAAERDRILAVRTLAGELLELLSGSPEPALLQARLSWWQGALAGQAEHPALAALRESGGPPAGDFGQLLVAVAEQAEPVRFERFEGFWRHCRELGGQVAMREYQLRAGPSESADLALELGGAGWLLRRIRDIALEARHNRWPVPLDLQAQFQVARQDVVEARGGPGWHGLVRTLVARAVDRGDKAAAGLERHHGHLLIHWAVEKRLAAALIGRPDRILKQRLLPGHAGNVWSAWRTARRLQRRDS